MYDTTPNTEELAGHTATVARHNGVIMRVGGPVQTALEVVMRRTILAAAKDQAADPGGDRGAWWCGYTADDSGNPEMALQTIVPLPRLDKMPPPPRHSKPCVVCSAAPMLTSRGANIVIHVMQGVIVPCRTSADLKRLTEYARAGGVLYEHPRAQRCLTAIAYLSTATLHVNLMLDPQDPSKTTGEYVTVTGDDRNVFSRLLAAVPKLSRKRGAAWNHGAEC